MRGVVIAAAIGIAVAVSVAAPRISRRDDARWTRVEIVSRTREADEVTVLVRVRNVHGERRRVWIRGIDVSESLLVGGARVTLLGASPEPLPIAGAVRFPMKQEVVAKEWFDVPLVFRGLSGARRGHVDVVLDGSTWIRTEVALE